MHDVIIVGGGLAGLINSILLARNKWKVLLIERGKYPFHRVCGEYISNEVRPFLESIGCFPNELNPADISKFQLTSTTGKSVDLDLDLGGFGLSRYKLDKYLANKASEAGVKMMTGNNVTNIEFDAESFKVDLSTGNTYTSKMVIGAFGKRSIIDKSLNRTFMQDRSPYVGVKYHIHTEMNANLVALHNFPGGYCGISGIEEEKYNLCYLVSRKALKDAGSIGQLESSVLIKNPWLDDLFSKSQFLFDQPKVINEVSFARKEPIFNHILMTGDSAGMITPLCGNGMAMAIHSAAISSNLVNNFLSGQLSRDEMETMYSKKWNHLFAKRLWIGRQFQKLFGKGNGSGFAVNILKQSGLLSKMLIKLTHGRPF